MVPLIWGLLAAGHEVRVAGPPNLLPAITGSGVPGVAVGPDLDFAELFLASAIGAGSDEAVTSDGAVARCAEEMVNDLVEFGRFWRPDLVVHDPFNLAAAVAAQVLDIPVVKHLWAGDFTEMTPVQDAVATGDLVRRFGIDRLREDSDLVLDPCPPAMQLPPGRSPRRPIRFVPYNGVAEHPPWLRYPPARPRVCVTWGTLMFEVDGVDLFLAPRVVDALAELDVEVVIAVDPRSRPRFGSLPDNALFADALALHMLLPSCQAVVHQGGAGTTMTALAAGVPQLILPAVVDQRFNATQLAAAGGGAIGAPDTVTAQVHELLTEPRWRAGAKDLAEHNKTRPSPARVAAELPELLVFSQ
ncbi:nucleotide disphospho-sugar-binding domain-containing protein [Nocardia alni]|uniref:nucleotide disphospho-sugar-binding domain-containing protein n=1 Tax=Nocardia alni TaxID=2815723 RepID=UPI001C222C69|nr:nucleotide disphospho-sugar-binding domain-containing protein [Nocardia alni]